MQFRTLFIARRYPNVVYAMAMASCLSNQLSFVYLSQVGWLKTAEHVVGLSCFEPIEAKIKKLKKSFSQYIKMFEKFGTTCPYDILDTLVFWCEDWVITQLVSGFKNG